MRENCCDKIFPQECCFHSERYNYYNFTLIVKVVEQNRKIHVQCNQQ